MTIPWLLTLVALAAAAAGVLLGQSRALSRYMGAAGGGLLLGIALFWLLPEIAEVGGWLTACLIAMGAAGALAGIDRLLEHAGHSPRQGVIGPLLVATAIHSFVDGWSVRALASQKLADVAVPLGMALHKIPEGLAVGWLARRALSSRKKAALASAGVELFTVIGAYVQPHANQQGEAAFGLWWTAAMLSFISGSFLFLGFHAVLPYWRDKTVMAVFAFVLLGTAALRLLGLPTA